MAFLLLLHEKMRLKRQVNKLTLKQAKYGHRIERMQKNIAKVQKMYSSRISMIEKQAQMMQTQASAYFQNMMGLGAQNQLFNPNNYGSMTSFVANQMVSIFQNGGKPTEFTNSSGNKVSLDMHKKYEQMMNEYVAGTLQNPNYKKDANGNDTRDIESYGQGKFSPDEYAYFKQIYSQANTQQTQAQAYCQQMSSNYQNNISVWVEAQKAQLEAEQDAALLPLEQEQTDMELENDAVETQLEYARERLKNLEQACKEEIQNAAPKFGLG